MSLGGESGGILCSSRHPHRNQSDGYTNVSRRRRALEDWLGVGVVSLRGLLKRKGDHFVRAEGLLREANAVHVVDVVLELVFSFEGGAALGAVKGTSVRVDHHVLRQGLLYTKCLVALGTSVGFLS